MQGVARVNNLDGVFVGSALLQPARIVIGTSHKVAFGSTAVRRRIGTIELIMSNFKTSCYLLFKITTIILRNTTNY